MTYNSISAGHRGDAMRHIRNAIGHLQDGKPDYAKGSLKKAIRWLDRAEAVDKMTAIDDPILKVLVEHVVDDMVGVLLHGNQPERCTHGPYSVADNCQCKNCVRRREMNAANREAMAIGRLLCE